VDDQGLRERRLRARAVLERLGRAEFKPESSAKWVDVTRSSGGTIRVQIEHDTIKNCTPEMMRWWFENLAATTTWNGHDFSGPEVSHYHLWHHRDHVCVTPETTDGQGFAEGATTVIREQFNDLHERINARVVTTRLDNTEFTFVIKKFGVTVGTIVHLYHQTDDGLRFYAETLIGVQIPIIGPVVNWLILPRIYSRKTAEHWIKHNIEETGQTEVIVPSLYSVTSAD
jgi:hypothetical protein